MAPKAQIPVIFTSEEAAAQEDKSGPLPPSSSQKRLAKIRCPFDFTPPVGGLYGIDRVSRHSALWSMACVGLGQALVTPSIPLAAWMCMPTVLALVGGGHHDSRFRRGIGGTLSADYEKKTSNIPFYGMMMGDQSEYVNSCVRSCCTFRCL